MKVIKEYTKYTVSIISWRKIIVISLLLFSVQTYSQLLQEGFESPLSGWSQFQVTNNVPFSRTTIDANTGSYSEYTYTPNAAYLIGSITNEVWLISPSLDLSNYNQNEFSYSQKNRNHPDGYPASDPTQQVVYSTNYSGSGNPNTATWTVINNTNATTNWTQTTLQNQLPNTSNVYIAFRYLGTSSSLLFVSFTDREWFIDDVSLLGYPCPYSTTWNGTNWSNGLPDTNTSAIINGDYDTASEGSFESCHCTVNTGSTLNISVDNYVSIENDLTVNGTLEVQHEGSLVMVEDDGIVTSNGTINIHKNSEEINKHDYTYWSSPTVNETIGSALVTSETNRIYNYHHENGWNSVNGATVMQPATGYIAMGPTTGSFPQTQSVVFDGLVNTGVIQTSIEKSTNTEQADLDWNLIGNPYPSAIDATAFLDNPLNTPFINGTIYLWTHNTAISKNTPGANLYNYSSNDYASFTSGTGGVAAISGGAIPNGFITSGQSFFIEATSSGNVTFNNSMRTTSNNTQFFKKLPSELVEKDRIWLNLFNDKGAFSQLLIGFIDGATDGIDRSYDGPKFGGNYISFYSIIEDKNFAIQGKDAIEDEEHIKLGLYTNINQGDSLKISINKVEGVIADYNVYLKDSYKNTLHDLTMEDYLFIPEEQGTFDNRFELILSRSKVLSVTETDIENENLILINRNQSIDISTSKKSTITHLRAYDILGKSIFSMNPNKSNSSINTQNIAKGTVLFINARLENNQSIRKKVVIP